MAVTFVHTSGRVVTVGDTTRVARLLAADKQWTKREPETSEGGSRGTGDSKRRRGTSRKVTDDSGDDES